MAKKTKRKRTRSAARVQTQEPPITTQEAPLEDRQEGGVMFFWPKDKPLPTEYIHQRIPCPECRRMFLDNLSQAVICQATSSKFEGTAIAYFRCRSCDYRWKLPIREA